MMRFLCVVVAVVTGLILAASLAVHSAVLSGSTAPGSTPSPLSHMRQANGGGCC